MNIKFTAYRIEWLEKNQDKHNRVIEITYMLEYVLALQEKKIKIANHRIGDLERKGELIVKIN